MYCLVFRAVVLYVHIPEITLQKNVRAGKVLTVAVVLYVVFLRGYSIRGDYRHLATSKRCVGSVGSPSALLFLLLSCFIRGWWGGGV